MIGLFKQKSPGNIVVLFLFGLMIKLPLFLHPRNVQTTPNDGRLYRALIDSLPLPNGFYASLLAYGLLYVQALMVTYLVNEYRMLPRQNYLPGMAYLVLTSLLPEWSYLSAPLVSNTLIIWMFIKLFQLYNLSAAKGQAFNIGLLAGLSSYIYFPSAGFLICVLLGLMILKPFSLNEALLFLFGAVTPYYFYGVYLFLTDRLSFPNFFPAVSVQIPVIKSSLWLAVSILLLAIPFLAGGFYVQKHLRKMLIQVRKNWSVLLLYLLLAFFVPFVNGSQSFTNWVLVVPAFAAFHAGAYFYPSKTLVSLLLFFLTLGFILFQQYGSPAWR